MIGSLQLKRQYLILAVKLRWTDRRHGRTSNSTESLIDMKTQRIIAVTSLALLSTISAHAEINEGVQPRTYMKKREDVRAEAVLAIRSEHPDAASSRVAAPLPTPAARSAIRADAGAAVRGEHPDAVSSRVAQALPTPASRSTIRAEAVAAAHAPNQNLDRKAFVNSEIPAQFGGPRTMMR